MKVSQTRSLPILQWRPCLKQKAFFRHVIYCLTVQYLKYFSLLLLPFLFNILIEQNLQKDKERKWYKNETEEEKAVLLPNEMHSPVANLKESTEHLLEPECCGTTVAFKNALQAFVPSYSVQAASPYIPLKDKRIFYCSESFQHCRANLTKLISKYASLIPRNLPPAPKRFFSSPNVKFILFDSSYFWGF